jgi:septum formation protein
VIPIFLASASSSRAAILTAAGVPFSIKVSGLDEEPTKARMSAEQASPGEIAQALADLKAASVSRTTEGLVIGADQTLEFDGRLYDKTHSLAETRARLEALRGRTHCLHSAVAVARNGRIAWRARVSATLAMRDFSDDFLDAYLARFGEAVASSVGAYHYEGEGAQLFDRVTGDFFAILGLPLIELLGFLREAGGLPK